MPSDANGNYSLPPQYFVQNGDTVLPVQHNPPFEDVAQGLTNRVMKDGRTVWAGDMQAGGFKITGLGDGENDQDAVTLVQLTTVMPIGTVVDYALSTAPPQWLLCFGQVLLSDTPHTALRSALISDGFPYGQDGGGNPLLPDVRGRVSAGKDDMGGTSADRLTDQSGGIDGDILGATGGDETHTLTTAELAAHGHGGGTLVAASHAHDTSIPTRGFATAGANDADRLSRANLSGTTGTNVITSGVSGPLAVTGSSAEAGGDEAHNNVQPTIIFNKIIFAGL